MGSIAFCCIIILPALCSMALGIGLVVGLCVRNCKECAETECADSDDDSYLVLDTVLGVVLVIICNPCCSFGILIHWKCFGDKTATDCNNDDHDDHDHHAGIKMQSKDAENRHVNAGGQDQSENTIGKSDASKTAALAHL